MLLQRLACLVVLAILGCAGGEWFGRRKPEVVAVDTADGKVVGQSHSDVNVYLGIPYAEPPVGRLRFRPPRKKIPWYPATYRALHFAPECLQSTLYVSYEAAATQMSEDCLYLNIWQPRHACSAFRDRVGCDLLPVLVWIYGGAFIHGGANRPEYEGSRLATKGTGSIVVSLNYRLGALGFLVSTEDGLYGNYGLDDQKMALQWVKDNIVHFGGDPDRITLFGESAGAMSVGLHLLDQQFGYRDPSSVSINGNSHEQVATDGSSLPEERSEGRDSDSGTRPSHSHSNSDSNSHSQRTTGDRPFHRVILQSNPLGYKYRSIAVANFIGTSYKEHLDCEDLRCLQSESPEELIHVQDTLMAVPRSIGDFFTWGPVVTDAAYYREMRLRPGPVANVTVRQPIEALRELQRMEVPIIIGTNTHEGTVFVFTAYPARMTKLVYQALVFSFFRTAAPRVLRMYAPLAKLLAQSAYPDYRLVLSRIIGDYLFRCPNSHFAAQLVAVGASVYSYEFALPTRTPGFPCCDGLACHTAELPYVFNQMGVIQAEYTWQEGATQELPPFAPAGTAGYGVGSDGDPHGSIAAESVGAASANGLGGELLSALSDTARADTGGGTAAMAEITGAANAWRTYHSASSVTAEPGRAQQQSRLRADAEVSRQMATFWTTFAAYGDPNGQPAYQSAGQNGYVAGTRQADMPWWPRLLGDIIRAGVAPDGVDVEEGEALDGEHTIGPAEDAAQWSDQWQDDDSEGPVIRSALGQTSDDWGEVHLLPADSHRIHRSPTTDRSTRARALTAISRSSSALGRLRDRSFASQQYTHQMVFDEETSVNIIENDCICTAWNQLEYKF